MDIEKGIKSAKEKIKILEKEVELSRLYRRITDLERERMNPYSPPNTPIFPTFPKYSNNWWENPIM